MIKDVTISATLRPRSGKGPARRLRAEGMIPAAIYGEGQPSLALAVKAKDIANILRSDSGHNTIFKLTVEGADSDYEPSNVMIKDWQVDPVKGRLLHADLIRLSLTTATRVSIPILTKGDPIGVKLQGGILEVMMREVEAECLPGDIPEHIAVDVSSLNIGNHATVADLIYDREKIRVLSDEHQTVAGVIAPRLVEEVAPAVEETVAPEAAAEPEVIKKGKTEE